MKRLTKSLIVITLLIVSFLFNSCYKDRFSLDELADSQYNPELAAPLIRTTLTMSDVTEQSSEEWKEYPDGLLSLIYRQTASTDLALEIINIPDQTADTSFQVYLPPTMIPGDSTSKLFNFDASVTSQNGERLDTVFFKDGFVDFEVTSNLNHNAKIQIIIPELTIYGVTFLQTVDIPSAGGATHTVTFSFPIKLYTAIFDHPTPNQNIIKEYIRIYVNHGVAANNSPYDLTIKQRLRDVSVYYASGYFGQQNFDIAKEVIGISLFDNRTVEEIFMEDPRLKLKFYNSFGFPVGVTMDEFYVEKDGSMLNVTSTNLPSFNIVGASKPNQFDTTVLIFDKTNSNIIDLFNFQPKKVGFREKLVSNPTGAVVQNFVLDTSRVYVEAEVELPLYGRALNFTLSDTTKFSLDEVEGVISAELRFNILNSFPAEANFQIYLADSNGLVLDSLLSGQEQVLTAASVGPPPDYRTTIPVNKTTVVVLGQGKLANLWKTEKIIYKAMFSTADQGLKVVKIYSDYYLDIKMAAKLNYQTNI